MNGREVFGHERGNVEWLKALRRMGASIAVGVSAVEGQSQLKRYLLDNNFEVFDVPFGCQWSKKFFVQSPKLIVSHLSKVYKSSLVLASQVRHRNATHILMGNPLAYSFVAPYLGWNKKLTLIYRQGDEPSHDSRLNLWIWKKCFARASAVVANSEFVRCSIQRAVGNHDKIKLIYNVAPQADIEFKNRKPLLEISRSAKRVLFVGQMSAHKGADLLVSAAIHVCKNDTDFRFDLLGSSIYTKDFEGTLRQQVKDAGLSDRIVFHGHVGDPTEFYRRASVLVVPSVFEEPAANVVLEAKRLGLPAIVFPSGGLPELVQHNQTGLVCATRTEESLRTEIVTLCNAPTQISQMESRCLEEYEFRFSQARFDLEWNRVIASIR